MGWLTDIPALVALPLFAIVPAAVAIAAHAWFRRRVPPERLDDHDVAGYLVAVVGVLYSVVVGFLVGTVWTGFSAAQQTADTEAGAVADAFNYAARLPDRERRILQRLVARYAIEVRDKELSFARQGVEDPVANRIISEAVTYTTTITPVATRKDSGKLLMEASIQSQLLSSLRDIGDARRLRIVQAQSRLPDGMLEALVLGGLMVICFRLLLWHAKLLAPDGDHRLGRGLDRPLLRPGAGVEHALLGIDAHFVRCVDLRDRQQPPARVCEVTSRRRSDERRDGSLPPESQR